MESQNSGGFYSLKTFVCVDCNHKDLFDPAGPLICPVCHSSNVRDPIQTQRPAPVYALEGFYSMKPYYCHACHKKPFLSTAGPFICSDCGSDSVEQITESLKREDPHFQALLGHPNPKDQPPQEPEPQNRSQSSQSVFSPFSIFPMQSPIPDFDSLFSPVFRPRDIFREGFHRRGTPFSNRQSRLLDHFFNEFSAFDTMPSVRSFFSPEVMSPFPGMSFEDLLMHISQQHPDARNPANPEVVRRLEVVKVTAEMQQNGETCAVCQENMKEGDDAKRLPCSHLFHPGCIDPWLGVKNTCPVCRKPIEGQE